MTTENIDTRITLSPKQMYTAIRRVLKSKLTPYVVGSPGIAKSDIIHKVADAANLLVIDHRLAASDSTDMNGLIQKNENGKTVGYTPMDVFPLEGDELPVNKEGTPYNGWLLFLDELPSAAPAVIKAAYKLILDRKVGQVNLHKNVRVIAAGNLITDGAMVGKLPTAMMSRMVTLHLVPSAKDWIEWAIDEGLNHKVISWVQADNTKLHNFDPVVLRESGSDAFQCPRTVHFLSKEMNARGDRRLFDLEDRAIFAGTVGQEAALDFINYCNVYGQIPTFDEIEKDPENTMIPDNPGHQWALTGVLRSGINPTSIVKVFPYIMRLGAEFQVITLKAAITKNPELVLSDEVCKWAMEHCQ